MTLTPIARDEGSRRKEHPESAVGRGWRAAHQVFPLADRQHEPAADSFALSRETTADGSTCQGLPAPPQPTLRSRSAMQPKCTEDDLWQAAINGDAATVQSSLDEGIKVDFEVEETDEQALKYKGRPVKAQCIHAAAHHGHLEVMKVLLEHRADVAQPAQIRVKGNARTRECQPIHMAAASSNSKVLSLLLDNRADPNTPAMMIEGNGDRIVHYLPIHDAAWFDRIRCIKLLLDHKAKNDARNYEGDTALHLLAKLGNVTGAEFLLKLKDEREIKVSRRSTYETKEAVRLLKTKGKDEKLALQIAVERGQFPPGRLHIFTEGLDNLDKAKAFMKVSKACPSAVPYLLRNTIEEDAGILRSEGISEDWKETFRHSATTGNLNIHDLAVLIFEAPQAFIDLIGSITDEPKVQNKESWPLPIRATLPADYEDCALSVEYQHDQEWKWDAGDRYFGRPWHHKFAPSNPKRGKEVRVKIVLLKGLADLELVYYLSVAKDLRVFTKLPVMALLKFMWLRLQSIFWLDTLHEVLACLVVSWWARGDTVLFESLAKSSKAWVTLTQSRTCRCVIWCCVASFGVMEMIMITWTTFGLLSMLRSRQDERDLDCEREDEENVKRGSIQSIHSSRSGLSLSWAAHLTWGQRLFLWRRAATFVAHFLSMWPHRILLCIVTVALAQRVDEDYWTLKDDSTAILLSFTTLLHWALLLVRLRALPWLGKRLLPVLKSVPPISGMVIILLFLIVGFVHAYWALPLTEGNEVLVFQIVLFLFAGEPFEALSNLAEADPDMRFYMVVLSLFALMVFLCCALNVVIAVLQDIYDQEQERVVCTYLQERARMCTMMFARPRFKLDHHSEGKHKRSCCAWTCYIFFAVAVSVAVFGGLVHATIQLGLTAWIAAVHLSLAMVLLQGMLLALRTDGWESLHLWFCHEANVDEASFHTDRSSQLHDGRLARIRTDLKKQAEYTRNRLAFIKTGVESLVRLLQQDKKGHPISPTHGDLPYHSEATTALHPTEGTRSGSKERPSELHRSDTHHTWQTGHESQSPLAGESGYMNMHFDMLTPTGAIPPTPYASEHFGDRPSTADAAASIAVQTRPALTVGIAGSFADHAERHAPQVDPVQVAASLQREVTRVRETLSGIQTKLQEQEASNKQLEQNQKKLEDGQKRLEDTCSRTLKKLEEIVSMASSRRQDKKTNKRSSPAASSQPVEFASSAVAAAAPAEAPPALAPPAMAPPALAPPAMALPSQAAAAPPAVAIRLPPASAAVTHLEPLPPPKSPPPSPPLAVATSQGEAVDALLLPPRPPTDTFERERTAVFGSTFSEVEREVEASASAARRDGS